MIFKKMNINDLPLYSHWPSRLLGLEPWKTKRKTPGEIIREFEHEKWRPLLNKVRSNPRIDSIQKVDTLIFKSIAHKPLACKIGKSFRLLSIDAYHESFMSLLEKTLKTLMPAKALVELGCGYGSIILNLAQRKTLAKLPVMAADFVPSAVKLTQLVAQRQGTEITTGFCDLGASRITDLKIPQGAIIFTSYALMYIPKLKKRLIQALLDFKPQAVVHLEPCYEHIGSKTLMDLMSRRYVQVNGYNRNLVSLLHEQQKAQKLEIITEKPMMIGSNPLLPCSLVVWKPCRTGKR